MPDEHAVAIAGFGWLCVCGLGLVVSIQRGREPCRRFAERLPEQYAELGEPRPGYFDHPRRDAYFQMIFQRKFDALRDPVLVEAFQEIHRSERFQLGVLLAGFAGLAVAYVWLEWLRPIG